MSEDIREALEHCAAYAERGYRLAKDGYDRLHEAVLEEEGKLQETRYEQERAGRIDYGDTLEWQMRELRSSKETEENLRRDLQSLRERQKEFSVVVFGRTEAGKSTLMEILRHGDGASIGKGGQRTTRDVRDYRWQGMKITDVPGICSFDGREDDALAMEAAKAADLILFLITDDAPQAGEAEKLAELRALGKSVLGLVNVKLALNMDRRALALRGLRECLADTGRLDAICTQFRAYAEKHQQDWAGIPFIYTHLRAAFLGQESRLNDAELYEASNFAAVEEYILSKVRQDGAFLRIKTFVDCVVKPMQEHMERLLGNSSVNAQDGMIHRRKWHELDDWREAFFSRVKEAYADFSARLWSDITGGIEDFVEDHYEGDISAKWNYYMKQHLQLEQKRRAFLEDISRQCERKQRELLDDLRFEQQFSGQIRLGYQMSIGDVSDTKTWLQIGAGALVLANPIVGIAAGLLVSIFGDSKEEKIRKQKIEIRDKLKKQMDPIHDQIMDQVAEKIDEIIEACIDGLRDVLVAADERLLALAHEEARAAGRIQTELRRLNMELWTEAERYASVTKDIEVMTIARIPGVQTLVLAKRKPGKRDQGKMEEILGAPIECSTETLAQNCRRLVHGYQDEAFEYGGTSPYYCKILAQERSAEELAKDAGYRLAQQLFCTPIFDAQEVWG